MSDARTQAFHRLTLLRRNRHSRVEIWNETPKSQFQPPNTPNTQLPTFHVRSSMLSIRTGVFAKSSRRVTRRDE